MSNRLIFQVLPHAHYLIQKGDNIYDALVLSKKRWGEKKKRKND
jgi:hypothetical protein